MSDPDQLANDIIVLGRIKKVSEPAAQASLTNWFENRQYGLNTQNPNPYQIDTSANLPPSEIVSRACDSLALAIETLTNLARHALNPNEAKRLDALVTTLKLLAQGVKAGQIDLATARSMLQTTLAATLDSIAGGGMSVLFGALGSWATTVVPNPIVKIFTTAGFLLLGMAASWYISDTNVANAVAERLTNALFDGLEALARAINAIINEIYNATSYHPDPDDAALSVQGTDAGGGFQQVTIYSQGDPHVMIADAANVVELPVDWSTYTDPKSPWNDPTPI